MKPEQTISYPLGTRSSWHRCFINLSLTYLTSSCNNNIIIVVFLACMLLYICFFVAVSCEMKFELHFIFVLTEGRCIQPRPTDLQMAILKMIL